MRHISILATVRVVLLVVVAGSVASADKLDDFKEAVRQAGCYSIPYSDLRNTCTSQQNDVHPWCDGDRGPVKCEVRTRTLKGKLDDEQRDHETLRAQRRDIESKRSSAADDAEKAKWTAEIEAVDKKLEASTRRIDDLKNDVSKRRDLLEKTIYTINKCIDYRRAVMNVFAYATDKVRGETDPDIKPYADTLRNSYPEHIAGHEKAIREKFNSLETCKTELP